MKARGFSGSTCSALRRKLRSSNSQFRWEKQLNVSNSKFNLTCFENIRLLMFGDDEQT
jgi:hypothetical protein